MDTLGERLQWCLKERRLKPIELANAMVSPTGGTSIFPGMVIVVDPSLEPNVGDIVVARINGDEEATCKRLIKHGGKLWLAALNPNYPMIEVTESTKLIGPVKSASYRFR